MTILTWSTGPDGVDRARHVVDGAEYLLTVHSCGGDMHEWNLYKRKGSIMIRLKRETVPVEIAERDDCREIAESALWADQGDQLGRAA